MKKNLFLALLAGSLLTACGGASDDSGDGASSIGDSSSSGVWYNYATGAQGSGNICVELKFSSVSEANASDIEDSGYIKGTCDQSPYAYVCHAKLAAGSSSKIYTSNFYYALAPEGLDQESWKSGLKEGCESKDTDIQGVFEVL